MLSPPTPRQDGEELFGPHQPALNGLVLGSPRQQLHSSAESRLIVALGPVRVLRIIHPLAAEVGKGSDCGACLFEHFSVQALFGRLPWFDAAAGEIPVGTPILQNHTNQQDPPVWQEADGVRLRCIGRIRPEGRIQPGRRPWPWFQMLFHQPWCRLSGGVCKSTPRAHSVVDH